jgi:hypothetical protein
MFGHELYLAIQRMVLSNGSVCQEKFEALGENW